MAAWKIEAGQDYAERANKRLQAVAQAMKREQEGLF